MAENQENALIFVEEEKYFNEVKQFIIEQIEFLRNENERLFEESVEKKRSAYEEHLEYKLGPDNAVLQEELMHNEALQNSQNEELKKLERALESPYFARLDFCFEGETEAEAFYIGLLSIIDSKNYRQFVLDWRSPLASLYYDADLGVTSYNANGNLISGDLQKKLQILISKSKLRRVSEVGKELHDDMLQLVLSQSASSKMKEIVSTLQKEQNFVIRQDQDTSLFIQGAAGSGKTSIALHRAAYLLYQRSDLSNQSILLISPNEYFSDYVSEVLPQLNEDKALSVTFNSLACEILAQKEERFAEMQFSEADDKKINLLFDEAYFKKFQEFIDKFKKENFIAKDISVGTIKIKKKEILDAIDRLANIKHFSLAESLLQYFRDKYRSSAFFKLQDKVFSELWSMYQTHRIAAIYEAFKSYLKENSFDLLKEKVVAPVLAEALYGDRYRNFVENQSINTKKKFDKNDRKLRTLIADKSRHLTTVNSYSVDDYNKEVDNGDLEFESTSTKFVKKKKSPYDEVDLRIIFSLYTELYVCKMNNDIGHLIVDEFEDLGLFEHCCLAKLFSTVSKTVIGDIYQNMHVEQEEKSLRLIQDIYENNSKKLLVEEFNKAYRSSYEIANVCYKLLPESKIEAVHREAGAVRLHLIEDLELKVRKIIEDIDIFREENLKQVAILFDREDDRKFLADYLRSSGIDFSLVPFSNRDLSNSILLLNADIARGLEFDAVIIFNSSYLESDEKIRRRELYVSASRALHRLSIFGDNKIVRELCDLSDRVIKICE